MTRPPSSFNRRGTARGRPIPTPERFTVETDLPADIPIGPQELAAITRLLGPELEALLRDEPVGECVRSPAAE